MATEAQVSGAGQGRVTPLIALEALGVAFGDIGTNVLFAIKAAFQGAYSVAVTEPNVLGFLSLVFWALVLIVGVKYLGFILRADNHGEGGIVALMGLVIRQRHRRLRQQYARLMVVGLIGAALLYGDGVITPAISVLSAVEGLKVAAPSLERFVLPITVAILLGLFLAQRFGSGRIGIAFGPIMLLWFVTIGVLGLSSILRMPEVLRALSPLYALEFLQVNGLLGFLALGVVVLPVAGAEALYADIGHFGARPIQFVWYALVFPSLSLSYFGQGALLISQGKAAPTPFFLLAPAWGYYPLIVLATMATVIASQGIIAGVFSLTRQAMQLDYFPRISIAHTSEEMAGQVYVPGINWALMVLSVAIVLGFRSSERLAGAYGLSVIGTMVVTSVLFLWVLRRRWRWGKVRIAALMGPLLFIDLVLLSASGAKVLEGAWVSLAVAAVVYVLMSTWKDGSEHVWRRISGESISMGQFLTELKTRRPARVPGTVIFLSPNQEEIPPPLHHTLTQMNVLHERVVLLTIVREGVSRVAEPERVSIEQVHDFIWQVTAHYGYMETPNLPALLKNHVEPQVPLRWENTTFFLGMISLLTAGRVKMAPWRKKLFAVLWRNALPDRMAYYLPARQVIELGMEVELRRPGASSAPAATTLMCCRNRPLPPSPSGRGPGWGHPRRPSAGGIERHPEGGVRFSVNSNSVLINKCKSSRL
jgi:KUP system potassium uptake protein